MLKRFLTAGLIAGGLMALAAAPTLADTPARPHTNDCFFATQWSDWRAPSPDVIYIRVNNSDIYRLDLSAGSSQLQSSGMHLVSEVRGSSSICSALDLDLSISDEHGFREPLIVKTMTKLTKEEAAAIPREFRP